LEKAIETAQIVAQRRNQAFDDKDINILKYIYENTQNK
jgi:hypothetical protein